MAVVVNTGFIRINQITTNANLSQGKGAFNSWTSNSKTNQSVGAVSGNINMLPTGVTILYDLDWLDQLIAEGEVKPPIGPAIVEGI